MFEISLPLKTGFFQLRKNLPLSLYHISLNDKRKRRKKLLAEFFQAHSIGFTTIQILPKKK